MSKYIKVVYHKLKNHYAAVYTQGIIKKQRAEGSKRSMHSYIGNRGK